MNYNNFYKNKEIIIIPKSNPKSNDKHIFKNNIDIKPKNNTYENIREIVLENKNNIKMEPQVDIKPSNNKFKNIF